MSTNLSGLGSELERVVSALPDTTAGAATAAAVAAQLGRGIGELASWGFARDQLVVQRDRAAAEVTRTCLELASTAPPARGRAVDLAGAIADASSVMAQTLSGYQRWAVASTLCDHIETAVEAAAKVSASGTGASMLASLAKERVIGLQQLTSAHPARPADNAVLEFPIASPGLTPPVAAGPERSERVVEGVARLLAAASPEKGLWSVDETLAVALACERISAVVARDAERAPLQFWPAHVTATDSWRLVIQQLSRLEQPDNPLDRSARESVAAVAHDVSACAPSCSVPDLADATQQLPALASFMSAGVATWHTKSPVFTVEERGGRSSLVRLGAAQLRPLQRSLDDTRSLAVALADHTGRDNPVALRRTWLHHHEAASSFSATDARGEAQARVHAALTRPATQTQGRAR